MSTHKTFTVRYSERAFAGIFLKMHRLAVEQIPCTLDYNGTHLTLKWKDF